MTNLHLSKDIETRQLSDTEFFLVMIERLNKSLTIRDIVLCVARITLTPSYLYTHHAVLSDVVQFFMKLDEEDLKQLDATTTLKIGLIVQNLPEIK